MLYNSRQSQFLTLKKSFTTEGRIKCETLVKPLRELESPNGKSYYCYSTFGVEIKIFISTTQVCYDLFWPPYYNIGNNIFIPIFTEMETGSIGQNTQIIKKKKKSGRPRSSYSKFSIIST